MVLPMKATRAAMKATKAMKAKTEIVYRYMEKTWPAYGQNGEQLCNCTWDQQKGVVVEAWLVPLQGKRRRNIFYKYWEKKWSAVGRKKEWLCSCTWDKAKGVVVEGWLVPLRIKKRRQTKWWAEQKKAMKKTTKAMKK